MSCPQQVRVSAHPLWCLHGEHLKLEIVSDMGDVVGGRLSLTLDAISAETHVVFCEVDVIGRGKLLMSIDVSWL